VNDVWGIIHQNMWSLENKAFILFEWLRERIFQKKERARFNGEIRQREKVMRGPKKEIPVLNGYQFFHNYIREHEVLEGKGQARLAE